MDADGSNWEVLQTADFPFRIAIPEGLPPTCKLDKQSGISYEVVSSLCVKIPKSLFRREETTSVIQSVHPILIEKHELHSTWPIYNQPDLHSGERGLLRAKLRRERNCYAPGDRVKVKIIVMSNRVEPAKIKSVAFSIKETVTFHGLKSSRMTLTSNAANSTKPASQHVETVTQKAKQVGKKLYKGDSMDFDLECTIPKSHSLMTISTGKHIEVSYTMRVYVDVSKAPIIIDHVPMVMTTFPRGQSIETIRKIGFVEGLSERELTIEDDDDASPQVISRSGSARPAASRSASFGGSSASGGYIGYNNASAGVRRRDTVMTNFSGPGMAGRGVPGQIFSYGTYGGGQSYDADMSEPPRMAFAGPPSVYDNGEGALSATERAALSHYQTATPHSALALGVDYSTIASNTGIGTPPAITRSHFDAIPEEARPEVQRHLQYHRQSMPPNVSPHRDQQQQQRQEAEEEKERLYQRARQQAERNQRKADERRQQAQAWAQGAVGAGSASLPPSNNNSRTGTPVLGGARNGTPIRPSSAAAMTNAEEEKKRLYDRARREAETYQRGYTQGATFPEEEEEFEESNRTSKVQQRASALPKDNRPTLSVQATNPHDEHRRGSGMYWLDSPTVDPLEARGIHAPASPPGSPKPRPGLPPTTASALSIPTPPGAFPTAEEEKKRLFDQAKADTERHWQNQQQVGQASGSSVPGNSALGNARRTESPASMNQISQPPPLSEKAQLARFQAAQDAVSRYQSQGSTATNLDQHQQQQRPQSMAGPPPTFTAAVASSPAPGMSEKEQMRLYYEAKDKQATAEGTNASSSTSYRHSMGPTPKMASPRPTYAPNFQNAINAGWQQQNRSSPLPQGPFPSQPSTTNGASAAANGSQRAVSHSHTISSPTNGSTLPSIPPLQKLTLGMDDHAWRGGTPVPTEGPWAPKFASSNWADEGPSTHGPSSSMPPPLPPKTPLVTSPRH